MIESLYYDYLEWVINHTVYPGIFIVWSAVTVAYILGTVAKMIIINLRPLPEGGPEGS